MPIAEDAKKLLERLTGSKRPSEEQAHSLVNARKANRYAFKDDGETPNNPTLPLIHYHSVIRHDASFDPAAIFEVLFKANGWGESWRDSIYDFLHFHTHTHEVLGIARGHARAQFGGAKGRVIDVKAGDVIILPAGTGHCRKSASRDLLVVGAYPGNVGKYDEPKPRDVDLAKARAAIRKVHLPARDPVYGRDGPLRQIWHTARGKA